MKVAGIVFMTSLASAGIWLWQRIPPVPPGVILQAPMPAQTNLMPTPRSKFTPTTRKGYYNIDVVGDFTLPATKKLIFAGAGRNLHVQQDRTKLFRRGFSAVDLLHMVPDVEIWHDINVPPGWKTPLTIDQRAFIIYRNYFLDSFKLPWAADNTKAEEVIYKLPPSAPVAQNNLYQACRELRGGCWRFGDCGPTDDQWRGTIGTVILDIENNYGISNEQEQANLYTFMMKNLKNSFSPQTEIGSTDPLAHNGYGYSRAIDYTAGADLILNLPAKQTATSRQRGMTDDIVGKSYNDYADYLMAGTYFLPPEFDYAASHTGDGERHWLGAVLAEQEVNRKLTNKKRIAWQWLFNQQSGSFANSEKAEHSAPPAVAEGTAIFYWFTGAYGVIFWDDQIALTPDQPTPADPNLRGIGNDRNYACYEHYIHGLWRLFGHHKDMFDGKETYLNEATDCSYDGGKTWYTYNANQIKTHDVPFARAIVNGNQILIAATKAYAQPNQKSQLMVRYVQDGYNFYTTINLNGDEIYLGRATMKK